MIRQSRQIGSPGAENPARGDRLAVAYNKRDAALSANAPITWQPKALLPKKEGFAVAAEEAERGDTVSFDEVFGEEQ